MVKVKAYQPSLPPVEWVGPVGRGLISDASYVHYSISIECKCTMVNSNYSCASVFREFQCKRWNLNTLKVWDTSSQRHNPPGMISCQLEREMSSSLCIYIYMCMCMRKYICIYIYIYVQTFKYWVYRAPLTVHRKDSYETLTSLTRIGAFYDLTAIEWGYTEATRVFI